MAIGSWRKAKPGELFFGGKGVLIPNGKKQTQQQTESLSPSAESPNVATATPSVSAPLSREERNRAFKKAVLENLNRNVLAEQEKYKK